MEQGGVLIGSTVSESADCFISLSSRSSIVYSSRLSSEGVILLILYIGGVMRGLRGMMTWHMMGVLITLLNK